MASLDLRHMPQIIVRQRFELVELAGFETRNKYEILDGEQRPLAFAAEQGKGALDVVMRLFFGHWRTFSISVFDNDRRLVLVAHHPFRFIFTRLEMADGTGRPLGAVQARFSLWQKRFDVLNAEGQVVFEIASPLWKPWTFPFKRQGQAAALVTKKWTGVFAELATDKDTFMVSFDDPGLSGDDRLLVLAAALFIDLQYFERKSGD